MAKATSSIKAKPEEKLIVRVEEMHAAYTRSPQSKRESGVGKYALHLSITATKETLYIPGSIGSGRVSTGFVYQVEGTTSAKGTGKVSYNGDGVATVSLGSISYWKIPAGKTAHVKAYIEVTGPLNHDYKVVISRINYKLNTNDSRYTRVLVEIGTKILRFR
jgi:hypothetical protein